MDRFAMQNRNLMELSAVWPLSHGDLVNWFNGPAMSLSDSGYGDILQKLKAGGLQLLETLKVVGRETLPESFFKAMDVCSAFMEIKRAETLATSAEPAE